MNSRGERERARERGEGVFAGEGGVGTRFSGTICGGESEKIERV